MERIVCAQTVLFEDDLKALKQRTGETATKDAILKAILHYLECDRVQEGDR